MKVRKELAALLVCVLVSSGLTPPAYAAEQSGGESAKYPAENAYIVGNHMTFTVFADSTGDYQVDFHGENAEVEIRVNGIASGTVQIPSQGNVLHLNKGINTIVCAYHSAITEMVIHGCPPIGSRGVTATYQTYEAEALDTNGTVLAASRVYHEIAAEASGRQAVRLDSNGESIKLSLAKDTNAITLRTCVPDNAEGTGDAYSLTITIGGDTVKATVSSNHTWVYGDFPFVNEPEKGTEHNFFDDVSVKLDKTYPAGTELAISKEMSDTAAFYIVDLIETELVEEAMPQPENSVSIEDFGAAPDDGEDDTQALLAAIDAAAAENKEVWLPAGTFHFTEGRIEIKKDNVTIRGAGMWHTVLTGDFAAFLVKANDTSFYDFKMEGTAVVRRDDVDPAAFEVASGAHPKENLILQNIWVEHYKVGAWTYNISGVHMVGCRIRNTFADGINLCKASCNSMVEQCSFRGTGDDSVAMWSQTYPDVNNMVRYNTISSPDLAQGVAIYGGKDITVCDNIISDIVTDGSGINISTNFSPADFGERILVERNTLNRAGSLNDASGSQIGAIWFNTVEDFNNSAEVIIRDNEILDSSYQGISFSGIGEISNVLIENNTIANSGTWAIESTSSVKCSVKIRDNVLTGNPQGEVNSNNGKNVVFDMGISKKPAVDPVEEKNPSNPVIWIVAAFAGVIAVGIALVTLNFKKTEKK